MKAWSRRAVSSGEGTSIVLGRAEHQNRLGRTRRVLVSAQPDLDEGHAEVEDQDENNENEVCAATLMTRQIKRTS